MALEEEALTREIIGAAFEVHKTLGYGFLENVYENAMLVEVRLRGLAIEHQAEIRVLYKGVEVGFYRADLFVEGRVIVELKVASEYCSSDEAQLLNELKATSIKVGLLINFGRNKVAFKRLVF